MSSLTEVKSRDLVVSKIQAPKKYKVVLLNDDVTPMEFVITLLISIFKHTEENAIKITIQIHNEGAGVAGVYTYEIAEQKALDATNLSRSAEFPLRIKVDEE